MVCVGMLYVGGGGGSDNIHEVRQISHAFNYKFLEIFCIQRSILELFVFKFSKHSKIDAWMLIAI